MKKFFLSLFASSVLLPLHAGFVGYLYPAGAQRGTTCEVVLGGRGISGITSVIVDGDENNHDVTIESIDSVPGGLYNFVNKDQRKFVDQSVRARFKGGKAPDKPEKTDGWDLRKKYWQQIDALTPTQLNFVVRGLYTRRDPLQMSPSLGQQVIVKLKISPNARCGMHRLRFAGNDKRPMLCNPVPFQIGTLPEYREPLMLPPPGKAETPAVVFPGVLNGQITPGDADSFRFHAKKGEKLTFRGLGRALLPFIGDGVPGHFQMILQVTDGQGRVTAFADDCYFDPDPVLNFTAPETGDYTVTIRDALYRGREDFVYRVVVTREHGDYRLLPAPQWPLPTLFISPDVRKKAVEFPCAVAGAVMPGQSQRFTFDLTKGSEAVLEVWARRSLSPLDSLLKLYGPDGKLLAVSDDFARPKIGAVYHHADSYLRFTAPETGKYTAEISDTTGAGGEDYRYRLRLDYPRPDFRIWSTSSGVELPYRSGSGIVGFVVERIDGLRGDIHLEVAEPDTIMFTGSSVIPDGSKSANTFESVCGLAVAFPDCTRNFLTLASLRAGNRRQLKFRLNARCGDLVRPVIPADESMQAFAYNHLTVADDFRAALTWRGTGNIAWEPKTLTTLKLKAGSGAVLRIRIPDPAIKSAAAELYEFPAGLSVTTGKLESGILTVTITAAPGIAAHRFNQVVRLNIQRESKDKNGKVKLNPGTFTLPALLIEIDRTK